jgi:hypothetical protein
MADDATVFEKRIHWWPIIGKGLLSMAYSLIFVLIRVGREWKPTVDFTLRGYGEAVLRADQIHWIVVGFFFGILVGFLWELVKREGELVRAVQRIERGAATQELVQHVLRAHLEAQGATFIPETYLDALHDQLASLRGGFMYATDVHPPQSWVSFYLFKLLMLQTTVYQERRVLLTRGTRSHVIKAHYFSNELYDAIAAANQNIARALGKPATTGVWSRLTLGHIESDGVARNRLIVERLNGRSFKGVAIARILIWPRYFFATKKLRNAIVDFARFHELVGIPAFWLAADEILMRNDLAKIHFVLLSDGNSGEKGWVAPFDQPPEALGNVGTTWADQRDLFHELLTHPKLLMLEDAVAIASQDWLALGSWYAK